MNNATRIVLLVLISTSLTFGQAQTLTAQHRQSISALIDQYALAREKKDTVLLKIILTQDVDQLVSNGEWRRGIGEAVKGMLRSSENNAGTRKLIVDQVRLVTPTSAIVDCRYEIQNADGSDRKMWSTFVVVLDKERWKIKAIRNMLPQR
jgi:uncharacterized protein (TIGR02246 family)